MDRLLQIMRQLRNPNGGCPWDVAQNFKTIAPCTLEEAYEVVEAIEKDDMPHLKEELGDLLLQVVFHAQMANEAKLFSFDDVVQAISDKMIDRHPHVFGSRDGVNSPDDVLKNWEADKTAKREAKAEQEGRVLSALDGVNTALPAMSRALKLQQKAARVGFDWTNPADIIAKIHEEADELKVELEEGGKQDNLDRIEDELGDVFFVLVNLARKLDLNPESALRRTNAKFERRFREVERRLSSQGISMKDATLEQQDAVWHEIKREEKAA
jgi:ATP diphosphatase